MHVDGVGESPAGRTDEDHLHDVVLLNPQSVHALAPLRLTVLAHRRLVTQHLLPQSDTVRSQLQSQISQSVTQHLLPQSDTVTVICSHRDHSQSDHSQITVRYSHRDHSHRNHSQVQSQISQSGTVTEITVTEITVSHRDHSGTVKDTAITSEITVSYSRGDCSQAGHK